MRRALQNSPEPKVSVSDIRLNVEPFTREAAKCDLTLVLGEQPGGGIAGMLEYSRDLFEQETAQGIVSRFVRLLRAAAAEPDRPVQCLEILKPDERRRVLEGFNADGRRVPEETLTALFGAQAGRTPAAVAVVFGERQI